MTETMQGPPAVTTRFCRSCGKGGLAAQAIVCVSCGMPPDAESKFCPACGVATDPRQVICVRCGRMLSAMLQPAKGKVAAGLLAVFLGGLGIHKFYLGYGKEGAIMLVAGMVGGFFTLGAAWGVVWLIGLIEGIIYLTRSDEEFARVYVQGRRPWF